MRTALISFQNKKTPAIPDSLEEKREKWEIIQTIALAERMRDGGRMAPLIVCQKKSLLAKRALELGLPHLTLSSPNSINLFSIWRWQKKHPDLAILVIGQTAMKTGWRLYKMHKDRILNFAFFYKTPDLDKGFLEKLKHARNCFCGSSIILEKLTAADADNKIKFTVVQPGIDLDNYIAVPAKNVFDNEHHFVFGMASSLQPASGALQVIRAMSALWQKGGLPPWEVRMEGAGPRFGEILEEAKNLGVASRLCLLGDQPLGDFVRHCNAWIAPGARPYELPEDIWAGIAAGLPVICSQNALHKERLLGYNAALRFTADNPQDLAKDMIAIMRDGRLREKMIRAGAEIRKKIGLAEMAKNICYILEKSFLQKNAGPDKSHD